MFDLNLNNGRAHVFVWFYGFSFNLKRNLVANILRDAVVVTSVYITHTFRTD